MQGGHPPPILGAGSDLGWAARVRMHEAVAYSTLAVTVGLAVSRPRIAPIRLRVTPGMAAVTGVLILLATGFLGATDLLQSAKLQWRPLLALTCIMVMTGVVKEVGAFERVARIVEARARAAPASRVFDLVFVASAVTPSLLNNDAAILLLTPVVVPLARRLYPGDDRVLEAFVFAVFLAPGVAPFVLSNPMNMIVAEIAGIGFNQYAAVMAPISVVGALLTFAVLRLYYRRALSVTAAPLSVEQVPARHAAERPAMGFLLAVFLSYPVMATLGGPIWSVAVLGAAGSLVIARAYRVAPARKLAGHVSLDILAFLWGVFLVVAALRHAGVVDRLTAFYALHAADVGQQVAVIGVVSALGSAVVDNHPMALLNLLAIDHEDTRALLAALVGGDIGPRLLPIGSLAGLLWMDLLRRRGIDIGIGRFVRLGTLVLIPTLTVSLVILAISPM